MARLLEARDVVVRACDRVVRRVGERAPDVGRAGDAAVDLHQRQYEGVGPVERAHHLVVGDGHGSRARRAPLHLNHAQRAPTISGTVRHGRLDVVAAVVGTAVARVEAEPALDRHDRAHAGELHLAPAGSGGAVRTGITPQHARRHDKGAAQDPRGRWSHGLLAFQLRQANLSTLTQLVSTPARIIRAQAGLFASFLHLFEVPGTPIPVVGLVGEPCVHCARHLLDLRQAPLTVLPEVRRHDLADGVVHGALLNVAF